jgi:hypothetical protein
MRRLLILLLLASAPIASHGCSCADTIRLDEMRGSKHVVAVRVIATGVPSKIGAQGDGVALLQILDRLKGDASPERLHYSRGFCCPLRIEAGGVYLLFMDRPQRVVEARMDNLVVVPPMPAFEYEVATDGREWRAILAGKRPLSPGFEDFQMDWLFGIPPPPPAR